MCYVKSSCFLCRTLKGTSLRTSWLGGKSKESSLKYLSLFGISFYWCLGLSVIVQLPSCVWLFATPWTAARQASLSLTISWSLLKLMSIESVMPSNHLILCHPLLLLPSVFPSIRVFSNESAFSIKWLKFWSFSFSISPSFRIDWFDLLAVQRTLKSPLQHHNSKVSVLWHSALFMVQRSHLNMIPGKTKALTRRTFVSKVMSLFFNTLSRFVIAFLPRTKCSFSNLTSL